MNKKNYMQPTFIVMDMYFAQSLLQASTADAPGTVKRHQAVGIIHAKEVHSWDDVGGTSGFDEFGD